jgi:hypothetical protein
VSRHLNHQRSARRLFAAFVTSPFVVSFSSFVKESSSLSTSWLLFRVRFEPTNQQNRPIGLSCCPIYLIPPQILLEPTASFHHPPYGPTLQKGLVGRRDRRQQRLADTSNRFDPSDPTPLIIIPSFVHRGVFRPSHVPNIKGPRRMIVARVDQSRRPAKT